MRINNLVLRLAIIVCLGLRPVGQVAAQTFTTLHNFTGGTNGDFPVAGLILSGNTLYGTTQEGGTAGEGTTFAVNTDGSCFTNLHSFTQRVQTTSNGFSVYSNSDGAIPQVGLVLSGNAVYGTANQGGAAGEGTIFAISTNGTSFTNLHNFTTTPPPLPAYNDGGNPVAGLIISGNTFYGTAAFGGSADNGTVFAVNTDGTGFTNLHSFTEAFENSSETNGDGWEPRARLILSDNTLYGTASWGGIGDTGTVFAVNTDGTGFTNLHSFAALSGDAGLFWETGTNTDGAVPQGGMVLSGNTLYGAATAGGSNGNGTVFALNIDSGLLTILHTFTAASGAPNTNSDGALPEGSLILSGNTLYGTTWLGGASGKGTVFAVNTDGTGLTTLYSFSTLTDDQSTGTYTNSDGAFPMSGLVLSSNTLFGTASEGGATGFGTVFSLSLPVAPPQLTIALSGPNVILTWPTNAARFTLESTTNLSLAAWNTNFPAPVVINGQNTVTNPISGTQMFYQLSR